MKGGRTEKEVHEHVRTTWENTPRIESADIGLDEVIRPGRKGSGGPSGLLFARRSDYEGCRHFQTHRRRGLSRLQDKGQGVIIRTPTTRDSKSVNGTERER